MTIAKDLAVEHPEILRMSKSFREIQELTQSQLQPFLKSMETHARVAEAISVSPVMESLRQSSETWFAVNRMMKAAESPIAAWQSSAALVAQSVSILEDVSKRITGPLIENLRRMEEMKASFARTATLFSEAQTLHRQSIAPLLRMLEQTNFARIFRESLAEAATPQSEDVFAVEQVLDQSEIADLPFHEKMEKLIEAVDNQKTPAAKQFLISLVLLIIAAVVTPFFNDIYSFGKRALFEEKTSRERVHHMQKKARESQIPPIVLDQYRIVTKQTVDVRQSRRGKSPLVDRLDAGRVVRLVEKRRKWCLVEWEDNDLDETIQGWIRSKYLKRISKQ